MTRDQMPQYMRLIVPGVTVRWLATTGRLFDCLVTESDANAGYFSGIVEGQRLSRIPVEYVRRIETADDVIEIPPP